jgi:hypothetical protein
MKRIPFFIIAILMICSCAKKGANEKPRGKLNGLHKYYFPDGNLYLEVNYKDSIPHGTFKRYFKSGKLLEQSEYVNGVLHGPSKKFHDNGQRSTETPYDSGRIHGIQRKYRKDGTLAYEAPYYYDNPCVGLKEFYLSGNPVKNYPGIVVQADDALLKDDRYTLNISLSDKSRLVEFYRGNLTDGRYIGEDARRIQTVKGIGYVYYTLPPGAFVMEKINIIAKVKTDLNNYYITQLSYNLAVENKLFNHSFPRN